MDEDFTSDFASYGAVTESIYSPTSEVTYPAAVDPSYFTEPDTVSPTALVAGFFDCDSYFELPFSSLENSGDTLADEARPGTTLPPGADTSGAYDPLRLPTSPAFGGTPFSQLDPSTSSFTFGTSLSPSLQSHRTASFGDSHTQPLALRGSRNASRRPSLKREPTHEEPAPSTEATPRPRKRGRPRLSHYQTQSQSHSTARNTTSTPPSVDDSSSARSRRLPHHQVERKYRENLNTELERLRRAIPKGPSNSATDGRATEQPKLSKAMVLSGAIDYIEKLEKERDEYQAECERLRGLLQTRDRAIG